MSHDTRAGLFLDLDGTIADSLAVLRVVYGRFLDRFGKQASDDEFHRLNGPPLPVVVRELVKAHALQQSHDDLVALYVDLIAKAYDEVTPSAGARELVQLAKEKGWRVAIVTSNQSALAQRWLNVTGLAVYVDIIIGGETVSRGKPDPEPYLTALMKMNCHAQTSLAVEDTLTGARSALAAGLRTCLINPAGSLHLEQTLSVRDLHAVAELVQRAAS